MSTKIIYCSWVYISILYKTNSFCLIFKVSCALVCSVDLSKIIDKIFWQLTVFPCKFNSPQVKRNLILFMINFVYELPHKLSNDHRLRIFIPTAFLSLGGGRGGRGHCAYTRKEKKDLESSEMKRKSQNWMETRASALSSL